MFIEALFVIAQNWKQPKYPLAGKWINEVWSIFSNERNPALIHDTAWVNRKCYAQ